MTFEMRPFDFDRQWAGTENIAFSEDEEGAVTVMWSLGDSVCQVGRLTARFGGHAGDEVVEVKLHLPGGIRAGDLKRISWARWLTLATEYRNSCGLRDQRGADRVVQVVGGLRDGSRMSRAKPGARRGRPGYDDSFYKDVASKYMAALVSTPRSPIATLSRTMNVSRSTAGVWVHRSRARGFLPPTRQGRSG